MNPFTATRPPEPDPVQERAALEVDRHLGALSAIILTNPEKRREVAMHALAGAVALADSMGVDVEAWLAGLRRQHARAPELVPPTKGGAS